MYFDVRNIYNSEDKDVQKYEKIIKKSHDYTEYLKEYIEISFDHNRIARLMALYYHLNKRNHEIAEQLIKKINYLLKSQYNLRCFIMELDNK